MVEYFLSVTHDRNFKDTSILPGQFATELS